jgi:hypothetical protein
VRGRRAPKYVESAGSVPSPAAAQERLEAPQEVREVQAFR